MTNTFKTVSTLAAFAATCSALCAADPEISAVSMSWDAAAREATITYALSGAPAVVTLDIVDGSGDSIGGQYIGASVDGDVFRKVAADGTHTIAWHPATGTDALPSGGVRAVVTAWPLDDTPPYMVVSLAKEAAADEADRIRYYPAEDFLPGGLLDNREYKSVKLVMRKVEAKDVEWQMGSSAEERAKVSGWTMPANETNHVVTLTNNYYLAVFETTHAQHVAITGGTKPPVADNSNFAVEWGDRPVEQAYYFDVRGNTQWPAAPAASSVLGKLRARTGLDFDLPSEAEWEYSCRAGHGEGVWGDGTAYAFSKRYVKHYNGAGANDWNGDCWFQVTMPGRGIANGGLTDMNGGWSYQEVARATATRDAGTAVVGSYAPNSWGLYDMHGNVSEMTLDWYKDDISALNGAVCQDSSSGSRVLKGGSFRSYGRNGDANCRAASRIPQSYKSSTADMYVYENGYRLCCRGGLR